MAFSRTSLGHDTWYQEQMNMINSAQKDELDEMSDGFDKTYQEAAMDINSAYKGLNIMRDAAKMADKPEVLAELKEKLADKAISVFQEMAEAAVDPGEKFHYENIAKQLENTWEEGRRAFIQESYNVTPYQPLATLDFPALIKQYIRFLGKELMPVQTTSSFNIEQRIINKFLVNNQTGEEYEVPAIYWQKDENGEPLWKKLYNAGRGVRINDKDPILFTDIYSAPNKKYDMFNHLLKDDGTPYPVQGQPGAFEKTLRSRLSYDFNIRFVDVGGKKVKLPGAGIAVDIQQGGTFLNGMITEEMNLAVVDPETNIPTGETINIADRLSGAVDFVKGTVTASSCNVITGIYVDGRISNETNLRTIGFVEYPSIRKFTIPDGCRFQVPFTIEDFTEATASLNFNIYNRFVQQLVTNSEMFEDQDIVDYLEIQHAENDGRDSDIWALESYTHTEYCDLDPCSLSPSFAGDPFEYRSNAIYNAVNSLIYELCDRGKLENLGFVIYGNPKVCRLINKYTSWSVKNSTEIAGVKMNHSFGVLTDTDVPIRVVASNRVDAYITIPAYQEGSAEGDMSKEYFLNVVAYPMDNHHIGSKHLRFARHLLNSPENAGYQDINNPGGQAALVTVTSRYKNISIQHISGRIIFKNSRLVPDTKAGLVMAANVINP